QTYPVRNILIVNTNASLWDSRFEQIVPNLYVDHVEQRQFDHGGTRAAMADASDADLLLFMTQDAIPADEMLVEHLVMQFSLPQVKAAYARQFQKPDVRFSRRIPEDLIIPRKVISKITVICRNWG